MPVRFVVGVATTAPLIEVSPATVSDGVSAAGSEATAAAASASLTETETVRPAATTTVLGVMVMRAPSAEPTKLDVNR